MKEIFDLWNLIRKTIIYEWIFLTNKYWMSVEMMWTVKRHDVKCSFHIWSKVANICVFKTSRCHIIILMHHRQKVWFDQLDVSSMESYLKCDIKTFSVLIGQQNLRGDSIYCLSSGLDCSARWLQWRAEHTSHTSSSHALSFSHTLSLSHIHTHTPTLVHFMHTLMHFLNMPVVTASYCGSVLPAAYPSVVAFIFFLFLVLSQRSHVSDTSPLILILSGVMLCNISLPSPSFSYVVTAGFSKIQNLRIVCLLFHELEFEWEWH